MSRLLLDEQPLVVQPGLAKAIGLNEAIVIQQLHYWIENNRKAKKNFINGYYWTYNSIKQWHEESFYFLSYSTVKRTFANLEKMGILIVGNFNKDGRDKTKWYTIDYEKLEGLNQCIGSNWTNGMGQNEPMHCAKMSQPLPEISTENTTEISNNTVADADTIEHEQENGSSTSNIKFQKVISVFNQNIHPVTPIEAEMLDDWLKELDHEVVIMAIHEAVANGARNMKYIQRILNAWHDKGLKTKEAVMAYIRDWEDRKKKSRGDTNAISSRNTEPPGGPSEETKRLEKLARERGLIPETGEIDDIDCPY